MELIYKLFVNEQVVNWISFMVWLSVYKLSLNVDKTNFILFGNRKYIDSVCISMNIIIMGKHIQKQHPVYISLGKENSANCLWCKF